ncbi:MAG: DsrE family protein [Alphaproteobacteria bacterium]|nr:DsrE family protein [Alphaproteobacteria bacterium]
MASYLLIESRDPYSSGDNEFCLDLARRLVAAGDKVTLFLVQNGVQPARSGAEAAGLVALAQDGVDVVADEFSLRERGIAPGRMHPGIRPSPLEVVIDRLAEGCKVIWH